MLLEQEVKVILSLDTGLLYFDNVKLFSNANGLIETKFHIEPQVVRET